ncbi:hypothetical protein ACQKDD_17595 [Planococcus kocurii]|uniref:hypothetical protein n=1 Tax=Planococcus kocurii TaxID=1374 RepID=UPI003D08865F
MSQKVHYFSFYLDEKMENGREAHPGSFTKIEYVKKALIRSGVNLTLISTSLAESKAGFLNKKIFKISESESHIYLATFRYKGKVFNKLTLMFMWLQIIWYVLIQVKKDDCVLVYHSLAYIEPFKLLKKIKKFNMILELNDLYHVVGDNLLHLKEKETNFIEIADEYIFINSLVEKKFNQGKPYVLSYGNYEVPKRVNEQTSDGKTHIVYAGIIENGRKAAELAVKSSIYLNEKFIMHILGFGNEIDINNLEKEIEEVNKQKGYKAVIFHGRLRGNKYSRFLHSCHIGVSSHAYLQEEMESANYTFPSKIPTYMSHDLKVVSPNIPCVFESPFAEFTDFYNEHTPQAIAQTIKKSAEAISNNTDLKRRPSQLIKELDINFNRGIKMLTRHSVGVMDA